MKSLSLNQIPILLDTTYIMPIIGIDVEGIEETLTTLEKLYSHEKIKVYYTPFNILEVIAKLSKIKYNEKRVKLGLKSIRENFTLTHPTTKGYIEALKLRSLGFRDLIDLLLYTTAKTRKLKLLTRDQDLISFLKQIGENTTYIITEEEIKAIQGK